MNPKPLIFTVLAGVMAGGTVHAQETMMFDELDRNHNGAISKSEAMGHPELVENFAEIDSNGNGSVSVDEYTAYVNKGRLVPEEVEVPELGAAPVSR